MAAIFISYASEDRVRVQPLAQALAERGWSVWWDRNIPVGKSFDRVIEEEIAKAKCVIVLWSTISVGKEWVRNEADDAKSRDILVPVFLDNVKAPLAFRMLNGANLSNWQPGSANTEFDKLTERISDLLRQTASMEAQTRTPTGRSDAGGEAKPKDWVSRFFHSKLVRGGLAFAAVAVLGLAVVLKTRAPNHAVVTTPSVAVTERPEPPVTTPESKRQGGQDVNDLEKAIKDLGGALGGAMPATSLATGFYVKALGMKAAYLTEKQSASTFGAMPPGAVIMEVESEKPVGAAGLHAGDVILAIGDRKISSEDDLRQALRRLGPGKTRFHFRRGEETKFVAVDCPDCKVE